MVRSKWFVLATTLTLFLLPAALIAWGWGKTFGGLGDETGSSVRRAVTPSISVWIWK